MSSSPDLSEAAGGPILLFDGYCNLCSRAVQFVLRRDPEGVFRFASLQSDGGRALARSVGVSVPEEGEPDTVVLIDGGAVYTESGAALRAAAKLRGAWPLLAAFLAVPRPIRDAAYTWIARHRTRWFGRSDTCYLPGPDAADRFLD